MRKIFLIGGLGADERVFQNMDLPQFDKVFVKWINPAKNESIENYAKRLSTQIKEPKPYILGVSFGGMMATEIAKYYPDADVFIVSSAKTYRELPLLYRIIGRLGVLKILPVQFLTYHNRIVDWFFGVKNSKESDLLKSILADTDTTFLKWALQQITLWRNEEIPSNLMHIHGDKDRILPINFTKPNAVIHEGGHLMILNKTPEIENIIQQKFTSTLI
ncbi:alpha/beta hydrolase [Runella rosea]|uniref:Alpha/beta hydrolase n=1 Tax=Runella rosea TaxID=2259595 RepID=A0A344TJM6_9BACT|nr:alpha/beta hydrolase [Runella rosea]AXE18847.1 alpha/beta hydrolase [Runella rosea]